MNPDNFASDIKLGHATIAVRGGERTGEQPFGAVVSPVATVRFAIGIEVGEDLVADITQSLDNI